jgi:hypothetical protein
MVPPYPLPDIPGRFLLLVTQLGRGLKQPNRANRVQSRFYVLRFLWDGTEHRSQSPTFTWSAGVNFPNGSVPPRRASAPDMQAGIAVELYCGRSSVLRPHRSGAEEALPGR